MTNKENEDKEQPKNIKLNDSQKSKVLILEIFLKIFVVISVILALTLYFYYKGNTFYEDEVSMTKDIHHLKAYFKGYENIHRGIKGYVEITEVHEGLNIIGRIEGLRQGTTHGIHVLEYSDITDLEKNKITDDVLKHYNPMNKQHSCPSTNYEEDESFHFGDFGNVIANQDGIAFISIIRNIPLRSLNGRIIVISGVEDKCNPEQEHVMVKDIIGYGLLNAYKPKISMGVNKSNDYFLREINSVNKREFENKNKIIKPVIKNTLNHPGHPIPPVINSHKEEPKPIIKQLIRTGNQHIPIVKVEQKENNKNDQNRNEIHSHMENSKIPEKDESNIIKTNPRFFPHPARNLLPNQWNRILSLPPKNDMIKSEHKPIQNKLESHNEHEILDTNASIDANNIKKYKSIVPHQINSEKESKSEFGDTPPKLNLFENLFERENQSEFDKKDLNPFLEKHEPILVNKSNEPQFLHMSNEHKMNSRNSSIVPIYLKQAEAKKFNPFIRNLPKTAPKQEFQEDISNSKLDDVFSKFFRDDEADNMPFLKPMLPQKSIKTVNSYPNIYSHPSTMEGLPINQHIHKASIEPYKGINMITTKFAHEPSIDLSTNIIPPKDFSLNTYKDIPFDSPEYIPSNTFQEIPLKSSNENPLIKPRFDFSFMEPNIEPLVHGLMKNTTSTKLVRNLDQDLLNPYKDNIMMDRAVVDNNRFDADSFIADLNKKLTKGNNKEKTPPSFIKEEKSDKHNEMDVMNKIDNINEIIKNKTINQLNNFKNSPHSTTKKQEKFTNSLSTNNFNMMNKIDPYENFKLLKFRERSIPTIDKIKEVHKEFANIPIFDDVLNSNSLISSINLSPIFNKNSEPKKDSHNLPGESTSKMMENISREENKIKHLNIHDEDKLFIKDVKSNINKLDNISNKFKNI